MKNEDWRMEIGDWRVDVDWRMETEDGEWRMEIEGWGVRIGEWMYI